MLRKYVNIPFFIEYSIYLFIYLFSYLLIYMYHAVSRFPILFSGL